MNQVFIPGTTINILTNVEQFHKIDVSPDVATWLLQRSKGNRSLRPSWIKYLKSIIADGEWQACHQGGALDTQGTLFDGHHRLTAISQQDSTVPMWFKIGCNPLENQAIDQGAKRSIADVIGEDRRIAEVLRLAVQVCDNTKKPSPAAVKLLDSQSKIAGFTGMLLERCPTSRRYFSSAPVRLGAVLRMLAGADAMSYQSIEYVQNQYRALVAMDLASMSRSGQALVRQWNNGLLRATHTYDALTRALIVFDPSRQDVGKIQVKDPTDGAKIAKQLIRQHIEKCKHLIRAEI